MGPNFNCKIQDHAQILVLVQQLGNSVPHVQMEELLKQIGVIDTVHIPSHQRLLHIKTQTKYTPQENEWGDFQVHRSVIGLLAIAVCPTSSLVPKLYQAYRSLCAQYDKSLYDARLLLLGPCDNEPKLTLGVRRVSTSVDSGLHLLSSESESSQEYISRANVSADNSPAARKRNGVRNTDDNSPAHGGSLKNQGDSPVSSQDSNGRNYADILWFSSTSDNPGLEHAVREFYASLFWVLEAKRMDRSAEKTECMNILAAPNERLELIGLDTDSRSYRKRCQGRLKKRYGDLNLLAGLPGEAILHYQTAADLLRTVGDWLWLAGSLEGLAAAHIMAATRSGFARTKSYAGNSSRPTAKPDLTRVASTSGLQEQLKPSNTSLLSDIGNGLPNDIEDKYQEALQHYAKFRNLAFIETEATFKAVKVFALKHKRIQAAELLVNAGIVQEQSSYEEKVSCYAAIGDLFHMLRMERKAALFWRVAAMQCVAPSAPTANWPNCYRLLLLTLPGFGLDKEGDSGWTVLQLRVMQELIYSARKIGNHPAVIENLCWSLHLLCQHLTRPQQKELIQVLQTYTRQASSPMKGLTLSRFPTYKSISLLIPNDQPICNRSSSKNANENLFIYSPISFKSRRQKRTSGEVGFLWVAGEPSQVCLNLLNPLDFDLQINNLVLVLDGVEVSLTPQDISLPAADDSTTDVLLDLIPQNSGWLRFTGYTYEVFDCLVECSLDKESSVQVLSSMPHLSLALNFGELLVLSSGQYKTELSLNVGQDYELILMLINNSETSVSDLVVKHNQGDLHSLTYQIENLKVQLPMSPSTTAALAVYISTLKVGSHEASLVVEYQGPGDTSWWRQAKLNMQITGHSVVEMQSFTVMDCPSKDGWFCVILDLVNRLDVDVSVEDNSEHNDQVTCNIPAKGKQRLEVFREQCPLSSVCVPMTTCLEEFIQNRLDLLWHTADAKGQVPVQFHIMSETHMNVVQKPVTIGLHIDHQILNLRNPPCIQIAAKVLLEMVFTNTTDYPADITTRLVYSPTTSQFICCSPWVGALVVHPADKVTWNFSVIPVQTGLLDLLVHCSCSIPSPLDNQDQQTECPTLNWTFTRSFQMTVSS